MDSSWNYFSQFPRNLAKSKLIKQVWSCKPLWHCKYSVILKSKVKFDKTYMKMSKYENSVFPHFLHSTVNLTAWRPNNTNVTLMSFLRPFTETITFKRKVFFKNYTMLSKLTKSVRKCQHPILWRNHQNWNLSFRNFLLKYEPRIKDKELHDKEQKIYTNLFYFYVLNKLSP